MADIVLMSIATHKLSRLIAKDAMTSPLRAPVHPATPSRAERRGQQRGGPRPGQQHPPRVGELITCPFCLAVWIATGGAPVVVAVVPRADR